MARISLKEQYDNKDVITQIYDIRDGLNEATEEAQKATESIQEAFETANQAKTIANTAIDAVAGYDAKFIEQDKKIEAQNIKIEQVQSDALLAQEQAEDAQTDADKGIATVTIETNAANGTLYTKTVANVEQRQNIPLASTTQTGLMNAQTYQGIVDLSARVSTLEAKKSSVYVSFDSDNPSQADITTKFTEASGRAPIAGDQCADIARGLTYGYDGSTWIQTTSPISKWSVETAGLIKGTPASGEPGTLFAEEDGTGSVNGWDELNTTIANNYTTLAKAFSGYSITELADRIQVKFDAVDGATSVSEEIPAATDEKAGVLSAADWMRFNGKQNVITSVQVTLTVAGWVDGSQEVDCSIATADNILWVSPAPANFDDYGKAGIRATAQAAGKLTFTATKVPTVDIIVEVVG